jgi:hypothetical protein
VVGGAAAVLGVRRVVAFAVLAAALAGYYAAHESLPNVTKWWDVSILALLVMPAFFGLVWLALPLWKWPRVALVGVAFVPAAVVLELAGLESAASFAKLAAATFLAWSFLSLFESVSWVVIVAFVIPWVDAFSVFRGPTNTIVKNRPGIFDALSFGFPFPGQHGLARLGIPDLLFFALFLAAAVRWGLRPKLTWAAMVASFGATIVLAVSWDPVDLGGLPALPLLSLAFLSANADLLWRRLRGLGAKRQDPVSDTGKRA